MTTPARTEVLVFDFPRHRGRLEGMIGGALERAESGGAVRVMEVILVGRDGDGEGVTALRLEGGGGGFVTALSDFRLGHARPQKLTAGVEALAAEIGPGRAIVAILLEHRWAAALEDAVARSGGRPLAVEAAPAGAQRELAASALAAVQGTTSD